MRKLDITKEKAPGGSVVKNPPAMQKTQEMPWDQPLGGEDPWEEDMATHSSILAFENPMDRGTWQATVHRVTQSDMIEVTENAHQCRRCKRPGFHPWVKKIPWRRKWQPTSEFLPGKSMDRGAWRATIHGVTKCWIQFSD